MMIAANHYQIELLPNGFIRVYHYGPNWVGLYNADGSHRSGDCDYAGAAVKAWIAARKAK